MHTRNCPECGKELTYTSPVSYKKALKENVKCRKCSTRKLSIEIINQILNLNSLGILNREIARIVEVHHRTVSVHLKIHNKESIFVNQPIDMVTKNSARCRKCCDVKPLKEFQFGRKGQKYEYRFSYCNKCRKKQVYLNLNNNVNKFLADRYSRLKRRAKKNNILFSITKKEFIEQYNKQNGLCFYTDIKLICEVGNNLHRDSLSVDKLIPSLGYTKNNTVFCSNKINTCKNDFSLDEIKQWMPDWFFRIQKYINKD